MSTLYIYHHLGMGDMIICNGIVRHYAEQYDKIFLFSKPTNLKNVMYMYKDNPNIKIIGLDDLDVINFMLFNSQNEYLVVGHKRDYNMGISKFGCNTFDEGFYKSANIPFEYKWSKFYYQRDIEKEKDIFKNVFGLNEGDEYVFMHDDPERGRFLYERHISKLRRIRPIEYKNVSIFDMIYTIENASEVHLHNSSFMCLVDTMKIKCKKLYYHNSRLQIYNPIFGLDNWIIVEN